MGVLEGPQVLWASRIRGADLRGLNGKVCFAQATATQELIVWSPENPMSAPDPAVG